MASRCRGLTASTHQAGRPELEIYSQNSHENSVWPRRVVLAMGMGTQLPPMMTPQG